MVVRDRSYYYLGGLVAVIIATKHRPEEPAAGWIYGPRRHPPGQVCACLVPPARRAELHAEVRQGPRLQLQHGGDKTAEPLDMAHKKHKYFGGTNRVNHLGPIACGPAGTRHRVRRWWLCPIELRARTSCRSGTWMARPRAPEAKAHSGSGLVQVFRARSHPVEPAQSRRLGPFLEKEARGSWPWCSNVGQSHQSGR